MTNLKVKFQLCELVQHSRDTRDDRQPPSTGQLEDCQWRFSHVDGFVHLLILQLSQRAVAEVVVSFSHKKFQMSRQLLYLVRCAELKGVTHVTRTECGRSPASPP